MVPIEGLLEFQSERLKIKKRDHFSNRIWISCGI